MARAGERLTPVKKSVREPFANRNKFPRSEFERNGIRDRATAMRYRQQVLAPGVRSPPLK